MMSHWLVKSALAYMVMALCCSAVHAGMTFATIAWTGDAGYTMAGSMTYDDTIPVISYASGSGSGIQDMTVSFYDPGSVLLGTFAQVTGGVEDYNWLTLTYNTATQAFSGVVDLGRDAGGASDHYLLGTIGGIARLLDTNGAAVDQSNPTVITVNPVAVPEPGMMNLLFLGGLYAMARRRSRA